jgi:hypothetical protein
MMGVLPVEGASSSAGVSSVAGVSFAGASSDLSPSTRVMGDEVREEGGATTAASASAASTAGATGAASDATGDVPPAALASPLASFMEDSSMDIVSFAGL